MLLFEIFDSFAHPQTGQVILGTSSPEFAKLTPAQIRLACTRLVCIHPGGTETTLYPEAVECSTPTFSGTRNVHLALPSGYTDPTEFRGLKVLAFGPSES